MDSAKVSLILGLAIMLSAAQPASAGIESHDELIKRIEYLSNTLIGNIVVMCSALTNTGNMCPDVTRQALDLSAYARELDKEDCN